MDAYSYIRNELNTRGIELCGAVPYSLCREKYSHKLSGAGLSNREGLSVIIFAVPYLSRTAYEAAGRNLSLYACARDYHLFFDALWREISPEFQKHFGGYRSVLFADASPIDEVYTAARAGLGVIGENRMLITEKYSSFVFLGEIITDAPISKYTTVEAVRCEGCGACHLACPMGEHGCLSALTQKKGKLTDGEREALLSGRSIWGCDMCQLACPHTRRVIESGSIFTDIAFFHEATTVHLTAEDIRRENDDEFTKRAYSWRGRNVILRNLEIFEENKKEEDEC